jgi:RNase P subunit RPR2
MTLAHFVQAARMIQNKTDAELADELRIPLQTLQDIEGGIELFLAPTLRQKLARGLKVLPSQLRALEKNPNQPESDGQWMRQMALRSKILSQPDAKHTCPECKASLVVRVFHREDLEGNIENTHKVQCSQCLFALTC